MRSNKNFTYFIDKIFDPPELFKFVQDNLNLSDYEMYQTFNMGMDYALFVDPQDARKTLEIIKKEGFSGIDAGYIQKGKRQVVIKPKIIVFKGDTLDLR